MYKAGTKARRSNGLQFNGTDGEPKDTQDHNAGARLDRGARSDRVLNWVAGRGLCQAPNYAPVFERRSRLTKQLRYVWKGCPFKCAVPSPAIFVVRPGLQLPRRSIC